MPLTPPLQAQELYDSAPCGLMVADSGGRFVQVNRAICLWLQYEPEELLKLRLQDLLTMGGRIFHQTHLMPLLQMQGSVAEVKLEIKRKDGVVLPMIFNIAERAVDGSRWQHIAAFVAEDRHRYERELVLQRRRAEELAAQIAQDQKDLAVARALAEDRALFAEQMVGIVSHDLRNPLHAIQMSATLLQVGGQDEKQQRVVGRISRSAMRAQRLISDLLDFTQARLGGGIQLHLREVDLHEHIGEYMGELSLAFPEREIVHFRAGTGTTLVDADRISQAVGNLVGNAAAYGTPGRPITITSSVGEEASWVAVHNEGKPIPTEVLPRLFEPMVRGPDQPSSGKGVGLGLYIVSEIAKAHGGRIEVESSDDLGTTFRLVVVRRPSGS